MKVICINNHIYLYHHNEKIEHMYSLTIDKIYDTELIKCSISGNEYYKLIDDNGLLNYYPICCFMSLEKHRYKRLEELGI